MHLHLEFEKCMEIVAVSGPYKRVLALKKNLESLKSVISVGFSKTQKE
jgi:metal-responsive CopG/Arc/MetJ family transcriptional regulator